MTNTGWISRIMFYAEAKVFLIFILQKNPRVWKVLWTIRRSLINQKISILDRVMSACPVWILVRFGLYKLLFNSDRTITRAVKYGLAEKQFLSGLMGKASLVFAKLLIHTYHHEKALDLIDKERERLNDPALYLADYYVCLVVLRQTKKLETLIKELHGSPTYFSYGLVLDYLENAQQKSLVDALNLASHHRSQIIDFLGAILLKLLDLGMVEKNLRANTVLWKLAVSPQEVATLSGTSANKGNSRAVVLRNKPWTMSIGHYAVLDVIAKAKILGELDVETIYLENAPRNISNVTLHNYFINYFEPIPFNRETDRCLQLFHTYRGAMALPAHIIPLKNQKYEFVQTFMARVQKRWESEGRLPLLSLNEMDRQYGRKILAQMGVNEGGWYVTVHVRESGFRPDPLRVTDGRDAKIEAYIPAIRSIVDAGGFVIRLGDPSMSPLVMGQRVLDYAHSPLKSQRMDICLSAMGRFHIGTSSGMSIIPGIFGTPTAFTNMFPLGGNPWHGRAIGIPKIPVYVKTGEVINIDYLMKNYPNSILGGNRVYSTYGIEFLDNDPSDIRDLIYEMLLLTENNDFRSPSGPTFPRETFDKGQVCGCVTYGRSFSEKYSRLI